MKTNTLNLKPACSNNSIKQPTAFIPVTPVALTAAEPSMAIVKKAEPEKGLCIEALNCNYHSFAQHNSNRRERLNTFSIFYLLSPGYISWCNPDSRKTGAKENTFNTLFITGGLSPELKVYPEESFKALHIILDISWIEKELKNHESSAKQLPVQLMVHEALAATCTANEFIIANKLFDNITGAVTDKMFIHARTLLLLSHFFERTAVKASHNTPGVPVCYYRKIMQAENIILSSLNKQLPHLDAIAAETGMSESNLKKYFKQTFGQNIYEYYLSHKMEIAKRMLIEKNTGIAEIAKRIGYENPAYFINIFKRYFFFLPGEIRTPVI